MRTAEAFHPPAGRRTPAASNPPSQKETVDQVKNQRTGGDFRGKPRDADSEGAPPQQRQHGHLHDQPQDRPP